MSYSRRQRDITDYPRRRLEICLSDFKTSVIIPRSHPCKTCHFFPGKMLPCDFTDSATRPQKKPVPVLFSLGEDTGIRSGLAINLIGCRAARARAGRRCPADRPG